MMSPFLMISAGCAALHGSRVRHNGWVGGRLQGGPGTPEPAARGHWETRDTSETKKKMDNKDLTVLYGIAGYLLVSLIQLVKCASY